MQSREPLGAYLLGRSQRCLTFEPLISGHKTEACQAEAGDFNPKAFISAGPWNGQLRAAIAPGAQAPVLRNASRFGHEARRSGPCS